MAKAKEFIGCYIPRLTTAQSVRAAELAVEINPANQPNTGLYVRSAPMKLTAGMLAMVTSNWWGAAGASLTTAFMETTSAELSRMILEHLNLWNKKGTVNAKFVHSTTDPIVRISRGPGGYYSYLGTDCLGIPKNQQTMNLEAFTVRTPLSEYLRVVPHEGGHALGCPHEHQRREILGLLDERKTIAKFRREQGWSPAETRQQVLTPLEDRSIMATPTADQTSIMAYWFDGSITKNGQPILGGSDINESDYAFMAKMYPMAVVPPPSGADGEGEITINGVKYRLVATKAA